MLNIRTRGGFRMERFDVEDMWDHVQIQPETSAYIRRLDKRVKKCDQEKIAKIYLLEQRQSQTNPQKLTQVIVGELAKSLKNIVLDLFCVLVWFIYVVWDLPIRIIGAIDRIVNRNCDLILCSVIDHTACDTSPHRLHTR